ncbi:hypothetical protein ACROYT_G002244 [Oculina patagonica]
MKLLVFLLFFSLTVDTCWSQCRMANWWRSFDQKGWSVCGPSNEYITGFYRNNNQGGNDKIYLLEEAKCCRAVAPYQNSHSLCMNANWWKTLDSSNRWAMCPPGHFLQGLYRTSGDWLYNIEEGRCCKPAGLPSAYKKCVTKSIMSSFDHKGLSGCDNGYYLTGFHKGSCNQLYCIEYIKCCQMVERCANNPCQNGASCVELQGSYRCDCTSGFSGTNCEIDINECTNTPCKNGATCVNLREVIAVCDPDSEILRTDVDECTNNPCKNGATCVNLDGSYRCDCKSGYSGNNCETDINECAPAPCQNGGTCVDLVGGYRCDCIAGYFGNTCEAGRPLGAKMKLLVSLFLFSLTVDTCWSQCRMANWWGSFDHPGWSVCGPPNEYITGFYRNNNQGINDKIFLLEEAKCCRAVAPYHNSHSSCINANWWNTLDYSNRWAVCPPGLFLQGLFRTSGDWLSNIEEGRCCKPAGLPNTYKRCVIKSIRGSFDYKGLSGCDNGYYLTGFQKGSCNQLYCIEYIKCCQMYERCANNPCQNGASCAELQGSYRCDCTSGFSGKNCEIDTNECMNSPCKNGGKCVNSQGSYRCDCTSGFSGKHCETDINECTNSPCKNGGKCVNHQGSYRCDCTSGFSGKHCETDINECTNNPCKNGATCVNGQGSYRCDCKSGYSGNNCETDSRTK